MPSLKRKEWGMIIFHHKIIKWAPHVFGPILLTIFNKCITLGYYPEKMKIARVVPIHKGRIPMI